MGGPGGTAGLDTRAVLTGALAVAVLYVLLSAIAALAADPLADRVGAGPVFLATSVLAVLTWAAAGWIATSRLRRRGAPRATSGLSAAAGVALGYLCVPGLLAAAGLMLSDAGVLAMLRGPLLSTLLAGAVAGVAALLAPRAPAPAPYVGH